MLTFFCDFVNILTAGNLNVDIESCDRPGRKQHMMKIKIWSTYIQNKRKRYVHTGDMYVKLNMSALKIAHTCMQYKDLILMMITYNFSRQDLKKVFWNTWISQSPLDIFSSYMYVFFLLRGSVWTFRAIWLQGSSASTWNLDHHVPTLLLYHFILFLSLPS
jgi:hypothetical protein